MTDNRIEKIRAEIERRYNEYMAKDSELAAIRADECLGILSYIDSMQEEPTTPDIVDEHWWEMLGEEPVSEDIQKVGSLKSLEYYPEKKTTNKTSKGVFDANMPRRKAYLRGFKDGAHAHKELIANKSVSEDLESVAEKYGKDTFVNECMENGVCDGNDLSDAFKAGANWQLNQIRKENE